MARLEQAGGPGVWQRRKSADDRRTNPVTESDGCKRKTDEVSHPAVRATRRRKTALLASMSTGAWPMGLRKFSQTGSCSVDDRKMAELTLRGTEGGRGPGTERIGWGPAEARHAPLRDGLCLSILICLLPGQEPLPPDNCRTVSCCGVPVMTGIAATAGQESRIPR